MATGCAAPDRPVLRARRIAPPRARSRAERRLHARLAAKGGAITFCYRPYKAASCQCHRPGGRGIRAAVQVARENPGDSCSFRSLAGLLAARASCRLDVPVAAEHSQVAGAGMLAPASWVRVTSLPAAVGQATLQVRVRGSRGGHGMEPMVRTRPGANLAAHSWQPGSSVPAARSVGGGGR